MDNKIHRTKIVATIGPASRSPEVIRELIRKMAAANPLWGSPRIHGELLKRGSFQ